MASVFQTSTDRDTHFVRHETLSPNPIGYVQVFHYLWCPVLEAGDTNGVAVTNHGKQT